jgi:hypothetical protein
LLDLPEGKEAMTKGNPDWEKWEKYVQDLLGLDSSPGSGNQFNAPGDAVDNSTPHANAFRLFIDCKFTEKLSYSIKRQTWEEWEDKADEVGKRPALAIRIFPKEMICPIDLVVIGMNDFAELKAKADKLDEIERLYKMAVRNDGVR